MTTTSHDHRALADVVSDHTFAQLVTLSGTTMTARPLTVQETAGDVLRFLISSEADWVTEADGKPVLVTLSSPKDNSYASVTGTARVTRDETVIDKLWSAASGAYFDGRDDPHIRVLEVAAEQGEFWDGPSGKVGQAVSIVKTAITGKTPGDKGVIDVS